MLSELLFLSLFVGVVGLLPLLAGLDSTIAHQFLEVRTCWLQSVLDETNHLGYAVASLFLLGTVVSVRRRATWRHLWGVATAIGTGALVVQVLKTLVVRERPSMIPGMAIGHSMPSGDITNGAIAIGAAVWLARKTGSRPGLLFYLGAFAFMVLIAFLRLAPLRHWFSDALASIFLALFWLDLTLSRFPRWRWWAPVGWSAAIGLALLAVTFLPGARLRLASPLNPSRKPVAVWYAASANQAYSLIGDWSGVLLQGRLPNIALRDGEGVLFVNLPRPADYTLRLGVWPTRSEAGSSSACARLEVTVNNQLVDSFVTSGGWRQYELEVPRSVARAGRNRIGLRLLSRGGDRELKLSYLLVYSR